MSPDEILDHVLIPRPNGSEELERVGSFLARTLEHNGAEVSLFPFTATPWGFQITWTVALLLMLAVATAILRRRYQAAVGLTLLTSALLLLEFELLYSPVSGLFSRTLNDIIGSYPGQPSGPTLIFTAHYDTTTHFGDHFSWGPWGWRQGPAVCVAIAVSLVGIQLRRRGRDVPGWVRIPTAALVPVPFAALFWFQTIGPLVREPSPGALDNGGSVTALLLLAEELASRPDDAAATVEIVFLAAEEERALGSWAYAESLDVERPVAVINLESIGASRELAYIPEDGFELRRYRSPEPLIELVHEVAPEPGLPARELPSGTLTDGRSFLAHGIPALTLRAFTGDSFPRGLHSARDSRERLVVPALAESAGLLRALVARADGEPARVVEVIWESAERLNRHPRTESSPRRQESAVRSK